MFLAGILTSCGGMLCLAATQDKQSQALFQRTQSPAIKQILTVLGVLLLSASAAVGVYGYGAGIGIVSFTAWACLGAWVVALGITLTRR